MSVSESKDPILRGTHFDQAADSSEEALGPGDEWKDELNGIKTQGFVGFPSNSSYSENKGPILRETHFAQAAESPEEALDLRNERKDEVLGDPRVGKTVDSYVQVLGSVGERKEAILNVTHIRTATSSSKQGLDLVGEKEIAGSDVSKPMDEIFESKSGSATVERIGKESECDVSDGRWMFDESYPLYTNNSCPFIDEGFSCESNGRLNREYVKWRWQPYLLGEEVVEESTKRRRESRIQQQQKQQKSRCTVDRPDRPSAEAVARSTGPVDRCAR